MSATTPTSERVASPQRRWTLADLAALHAYLRAKVTENYPMPTPEAIKALVALGRWDREIRRGEDACYVWLEQHRETLGELLRGLLPQTFDDGPVLEGDELVKAARRVYCDQQPPRGKGRR